MEDQLITILKYYNKDLDKGILRVRYSSNNRKLTNNLLKDDYKISKRMVNAIKIQLDLLIKKYH